MAQYDVALAVFIVGVNLAFSHCDSTINGGDISLRKVCRRKCPAGYFSYCTQGGTSRCVSCEKGVTYSIHRSRSTSCRPCSRCRDDEFEAEPCTPKKDVVCQKCSDCPPGFGVRSVCARTSDTVCEVCPAGTVSEENSGVKSCTVFFMSGDRNRSQPVEESKEFSVQVVEKPADVMQSEGSDVIVAETQEHSSRFPSVTPTPSGSYQGNHTSTTNVKKLTPVSVSIDWLDSTQSPSAHASVVTLLQESLPVSRLLNGWNPTSRAPELKTGNKGEPHNQPGAENVPDDSNHARRHAGNRITVKSQVHETVKPKSFPTVTAETSMRNSLFPDTHEEKSTEFQGTLKRESVKQGPEVVTAGAITSRPVASWFIGVIVAVLVLFAGFGVFIFNLKKRKNYLASGTTGNTQLRCPHSSDCCDGNSVASLPEVVLNENEVPNVTSDTETEDTITSNPTLHTYATADSRQVAADIHEPNKTSLFQVFNIDREKQSSTLGSNPVPKETFTAYAQDIFHSAGGYLRSPDSNVSIFVPPGAVQEGVSQSMFFGVVFDETPLLENIRETSERTLISPVIKCGPSELTLSKPVEIVLPHCLYIEDTKRAPVTVFRCGEFSDKGPIWESVPSATEKTSQSLAWFTVKKDTIHIRTKCFSFWSVFACGGPKKKRAAVFASRPSLESNLIYLRFYIYSDTADSSRKVVKQDKESFPDSKRCTKEKPFKMYNDNKEIEVKLTKLEDGWTLDKTPDSLVYSYPSAYNNGDFRVRDSCDFAVKPTHDNVEPFSCMLNFQQEDHPPEHEIYLNTGMKPRCSFQNNNTGSSMASSDETSVSESHNNSRNSQQAAPRVRFQLNFPPEDSDNEPVTERHCHCIEEKVGVDWRRLLRKLDMEESIIRIVDEENREVTEKCFQGLIKWMNSLGSEATTRKLSQALHNIGRRDVIEALVAEGALDNWTFPHQIRLPPGPGTAIQESCACTNTTV